MNMDFQIDKLVNTPMVQYPEHMQVMVNRRKNPRRYVIKQPQYSPAWTDRDNRRFSEVQ